jgi:hypothetical protein
MDFVTTPNALALARELCEARQRRAIKLLDSVGAITLADGLRHAVIDDPDPTWLNHVTTMERHGLILIGATRRIWMGSML